jgi:hypothetical protein
MVIDQRNAGASVTLNDGVFPVDRFRGIITQSSKLTAQQLTSSPPVGFTNYLAITSSSAYSVGSGDTFSIQQRIEGFNVADLGWGTANAKTVTLSFQVYSSLTGTFGGSLLNSANTRSYPFSYTVASANTWTSISVTIAGDTSGTWVTNNGVGIKVGFGLGSGATYSGTAGAWAGAEYYQPTSTVSVVGTNGATFYLTGVQLEVGTQATTFDYRSYGTELALCQRYYVQFLGNEVYETLGSGMSSTSQQGFIPVPLPVKMRSNPTLSYSTVSLLRWAQLDNAWAGTALTLDHSSPYAPFIYLTVASGMTSYRAGFITANNSTSAYVGFSAEL